MAVKYWYSAANANWASSNWYTSPPTISGPVGSPTTFATVDDAVFTQFSGTATVTIAALLTARSIVMTGFAGTLATNFNVTITGSDDGTSNGNAVVLSSSATYTGTATYTFQGTGGKITCNGKSFLGALTLNSVTGSWTFTDNATIAGVFTITNGIANINNLTCTGTSTTFGTGTINVTGNLTTTTFVSNNSNTRTINMGSGTWTLTGTGTVWNTSTTTGLTLNAQTSTIEINNTSNTAISFTVSSNNLQFWTLFLNRGASTGTITINGASTYQLFRDRGTAAHTLSFLGGSTNTFNNFDVRGSSTSARITLSRSAVAVTQFIKSPEGLIACNFITVGAINVTPNNLVSPFIPTWYAGSGSNDTGTPGTGWILATDPPARELSIAGAG